MTRRRMPYFDPSSPTAFFYRFDPADDSTVKGLGGAAITDNAEVYEIANLGTSSAKFVPESGMGRPTWHAQGPNGLPALRFEGSQALRLDTTAGLTSLAGLTILVVACVDDFSRQHNLLTVSSASGTASRVLMFVSTTTGYLHAGGRRVDTDSFQQLNTARAVAAGAPFIHTSSFDYANGRLRIYQDGIKRADGAWQTAGNSAATAPQFLMAGDFSAPSQRLIGWILGIYAIRSAPSADDMVPVLHYVRTAKRVA